MAADLRIITDNLDLWTSALLTKSTVGRGSNGKVEAYGIKKLRELILELAVRGKLVPQDPNDEPASVLLETIEIEKTQLAKDGKIKKERALPKISEEDEPYQIPDNWKWVRLPDLYYSISPSGSKIKTSEFLAKGEYPVIDQGKSFIAGYTNKSELLIEIPGPVVIFGDHTTEIKYVDFDFVAGADGTKILRPYRMNERYFYTYLKSYKLENRGYARHFKVLNDNLMALPPLAEQHRIVAKVDELMALCDLLEQQQTAGSEAHQTLVETLLGTLTSAASPEEFAEAWTRIADHFDTLFTTEQSIDQLKQTILQLAVMGRLVPQDPDDEPASVLMNNIKTGKEKLIAAGKIKLEKQQPPIADEEKWFDLPSRWEWVRFSDYAVDIATGPFGSMIHQSDYVVNGVPLINPSHMINDRIVPDMGISISEEMAKQFESYSLADGDIVMARRGEVGRIALVTKAEVGWLCGTGSFVLRFSKDVARHYLKLVFRCEFVRKYLAGEAVGTTMVNLNHGILKKMPFALPPLAEQHRIVAKVDELMTLCDALKARLADAQTTQIHLADAIVEQALA